MTFLCPRCQQRDAFRFQVRHPAPVKCPFVSLSVNAYFTWRNVSMLSGGILMKLGTNMTPCECAVPKRSSVKGHSKVKKILHMTATLLVQAFISCSLNYCNSLLYDISDGLLCRLQPVQKATLHSFHRRSSVWAHLSTAMTWHQGLLMPMCHWPLTTMLFSVHLSQARPQTCIMYQIPYVLFTCYQIVKTRRLSLATS